MGVGLLERLFFVALALVWGCNDEEACEDKTGEEADLCWAHFADEVGTSNPDQAIDVARRITDRRIRDITLLALAGQFTKPRECLAACWEIHDVQVREKCLTYQRRAHLWASPDRLTGRETSNPPAQKANRPECADLPVNLRDSCELQFVLSSLDLSKTTARAQVANDSQCRAISNPETLALCQTEIAERRSRTGGLQVGISACESIEMPLMRRDCFLRVRSTHPEEPVEQQLEVCRLAGDLEKPCRTMIRISAAAVLVEHHREKPVQAALDDLDREIRESAAVLAIPGTMNTAAFLARDMWYRVLARLIEPSGARAAWSIEDLGRWVPVIDHLEPSNPLRAMLRATLLQTFGVATCVGVCGEVPNSTETSQPQHVCNNTTLLSERFTLWIARVREQGLELPASLGPQSSNAVQTNDWWVVYRSDVGGIPIDFQNGCPMTQTQADEIAAMWVFGNGDWECRKAAFKAALLSKNPSLRKFAVRRLHHRLFREGPHLGEIAVTTKSLTAWMGELDPRMRAFLEMTLNALERGDPKPPRKPWSECPGENWPSGGAFGRSAQTRHGKSGKATDR